MKNLMIQTLNDNVECPRVTELYEKAMNSDEIKQLNKDNIVKHSKTLSFLKINTNPHYCETSVNYFNILQEFFEFIKVKSGVPLVDLLQISHISDTLTCEASSNGKTKLGLYIYFTRYSTFSHTHQICIPILTCIYIRVA